MTDNPNPSVWPGPLQRYPRFSRTALAAALTVLALAGPQLEAQALALGAVSVQSALGEPLRARVELPQINSEEASSLEVRIGSPATFAAAGVSYVPALAGASVRLQRRPNGTAYLSISGQRPINEPLVDLVVEANWNGGHVVRNYTMLIDPPLPVRAAAPEAATAPLAAPANAPAPGRTRPVAAAPAAGAQKVRPGKRRPATAQAATHQRSGQVRVRRGSTASQIAVAGGLRGVSLDQMLLAMLQANPDAFINNNVNLIKAGALLRMPSLEEAKATSRAEARRIILAQTADFNAYRSGLAANVSSIQVATGGQTDQGEVRTEVQDSAEDSAPSDRLEITKATDGEGSDDAATSAAQSREALDQSERLAELDRNISELSELTDAQGTDADAAQQADADVESAATGTDAAGAGAPSESDVAAAGADGSDSAAPDTEAVAADEGTDDARALEASGTSDAGSGSTGQVDASDESGTPVGLAAPAGMDTQAQPSWMDLLERYRWPIALVLALLALLGIYSSRRRRNDDEEEDFFSASRAADLPPAPSQAAMAAAATVAADRRARMTNPMQVAAEALSAGDEAHAQQILEDALRTNPERAPIYQRLAEIHARRGDVKGLASIARRARDRLGTSNAIWTSIAALGTSIDPDNSLYKTHEATVAIPDAGDPLDPSTFWSDTEFGSNGAEPMDVGTQQGDHGQPTIAMPELPDLELDFAPPTATGDALAPDPDATPETERVSADERFELKLDDPPASDGIGQDKATDATFEHESLPGKLERAQSLVDVGDLDTARKLAAEVAKSATGELRTRAEDFLLSLLNR